MARDLYNLAKECADIVVSTAQAAGYDISAKRAVFFRSDVGDLANDIYIWLEGHMTPEETV